MYPLFERYASSIDSQYKLKSTHTHERSVVFRTQPRYVDKVGGGVGTWGGVDLGGFGIGFLFWT
jgi:hypothetical protein